MHAHLATARRRRAATLARAVAGPALAISLLTLGFGLLFDAGAAEDSSRIGPGPGLRLPLGIIHLAGGIVLLAPSLAVPTSILLGSIAAVMAACLFALGWGVMAGGPALTAALLLSYGADSALRRRATVASWHGMLLRYGEESDARAPRGH